MRDNWCIQKEQFLGFLNALSYGLFDCVIFSFLGQPWLFIVSLIKIYAILIEFNSINIKKLCICQFMLLSKKLSFHLAKIAKLQQPEFPQASVLSGEDPLLQE